MVTGQRAAIAAEQARLAADMAERERQAEDLARSAGLLRAVFDTDSSMLFLKDIDGRFVTVNAAFLNFWSLREDQVVGRSSIEVFGDAPGVQASLALDRRAWAGEATAEVEQQVERDGRLHDVVLARRLVDAPGGRRLLLGVARDVTVQKAQAARLERQHAFTSDVIDHMEHGVFVKDASMRYLLVNDTYARLCGRPREDLLGRTPREVFGGAPVPIEFETIFDADQRVLATGIRTSQEDVIDFGAGPRRFLAVKSPIALADGEMGVLAVVRDITDEHARTRALALQEALLRDVIDLEDDGIHVKDADGRFLLVNGAYAKGAGLKREVFAGATARDLFGDAPAVRQAEENDRRVLAEQRRLAFEYRHDAGRGERRMHAIKRPITLADGSQGILTVVRDVTDERAHEASLREAMLRAQAAVEARSRFVANMSHEIRTPINGIMGMTDLVLGSTIGVRQREWLTLARQSADNLLAIVNDVLDLAKIDAGATPVERVPFDLHETIVSAARPGALRAATKGLGFDLVLDPALPAPAQGDALRLRQVLKNLLGNAVKFTDHGRVALKVALAGDDARCAVFRVEDTGPGIDAALHERIFEPFAQADESTTRRHGGTGLGLPISRQLVGLMGGRLWLESAPGRGSCFAFQLPLLDAAAPAADAPLAGLTLAWLGAGEGGWSAWARRWGADVLECTTPAQALAASAQAVDGVVFDHVAEPDALVPALQAWRGHARLTHLVWIETLADAHGAEMRGAADEGPADPLGEDRGGLAAVRGLRQARLSPPFTPAALRSALRPRPTDLAPRPPEPPATATPLRLAGRRVLLAEDNPVNRTLASNVLAQLGAEVTAAVDGREALALLGGARFDFALMDIQMPELDGCDVVRQWRAREADAQAAALPIIAMTAHAMAGDRERFIAQGFDGYVGKPFTRAGLLAETERLVQIG